MILNTRLLLFALLFTGLVKAQEQERQPNQYSEDPETVFLNFELYYPVSLGNSTYADYNFDPGYAIDFNWFFRPEFTLGARLAVHRGFPQDISETGNITRGTFHLLGADLGYYVPLEKDWNLHYKAGIGITSNVYQAKEDKFSEDGGKVWLSAEVAKRLDRTFGLFLKAGLDYDFNTIETSAEKNNYFNRNFLFTVGAGIRINFQNPGG